MLRPALSPPLKWAGGKRWQVPRIAVLWEEHRRRRFVEPFCGGLGMALGLAPRRAFLNDINPHLVNFYLWLQRGLRIEFPMTNREDVYYQYRDRFNALVAAERGDSAEAAGLFYFLNRTGFNGLCRFNRRGAFNVPFGRYSRIRYTSDFSAYREALSRWTFTAEDVSALDIDPDDFVYADPPYDVGFTSFSRQGFTWPDQQRTATLLARHRGPVVLVNQATDRIVHLYRELGFDLRFVEGPRRISCTGNRTPVREVIATRNL